MFKNAALAISLLVFIAASAVAQSPDSTTPPLQALQNLLDKNPKVAMYRGDFATTVETALKIEDQCSMSLRTDMNLGGKRIVESKLVDLKKYSPTVAMVKWEDANIWSVRVYTSSGDNETPVLGESDGTSKMVKFVELTFGSEAVSQRGAALLKSAIMRCGGKATTAAARVAQKQNEVDPDGLKMFPECKQMVASALKLPSSATFTSLSRSQVLRDERDGTLTIIGDVQAENVVGGKVVQHFACFFERSGETWIPKGRALIY